MLGQYKQAIECYDNSLEIDPDDSRTWKEKGDCLSKLGTEKATKSVLTKQKCWNNHSKINLQSVFVILCYLLKEKIELILLIVF